MKNLHLPPEHHLLGLTAITPAHCGSTHGSAAIDSPVAVDAWRSLPLLPASALKGVIAGRNGNVLSGETELNRQRCEVYGAPDRDDAGDGNPGKVIFGDGDPLAFPLLLADGRRVFAVIAETIFRLARWGFLPIEGLHPVESDLAVEGFGLDGRGPEPAALDLPPLSESLKKGHFGICEGLMRQILGVADSPLLVAAPKAARALWLAAVEERTLTALEVDRRVKDGSLRTIELIPAGASFVSILSNFHTEPIDLGPASPLQLGAWENCGLGYFDARFMESPPPPAEASTPRRGWFQAENQRPDYEVMTLAFEAVSRLAKPPEAESQSAKPPDAGRVRSAIYDLGPRLAQQGFHASLAFCLAKAGGRKAKADGSLPEPSCEQAAYRWLLARLFNQPAKPFAKLHGRVADAIETGQPPAAFEPTRLWLRRYAEILLPRGEGE